MTSTRPSPSLTLGILAHVDAGKTSLTERLLYEAGAIDAPGSVDAGTTRTDSMDLERRRGITIRAAVTSFDLGDLTVNLVDTPGHSDFIAEVERSLTVLDAAVLVISAVEGVQPQTVVLWRALRRLDVPTVLFVNKTDRSGSAVDRVIAQVRSRLTPEVLPLVRVCDEGTPRVGVQPVPWRDDAVVAAAADVDDRVLENWVDQKPSRGRDLRAALRRGVRTAAVVPLTAGSAITGAGTPDLRRVLADLVPRPRPHGRDLAATVFAVDRDGGSRRSWVRLWSGRMRVRDRVSVGEGRPRPVTEIAVSRPGGLQICTEAVAGDLAAVRGPEARIGDELGRCTRRRRYDFPPPTRQALVLPADPTRRGALFAGLADLADEDPLIGLHIDEHDEEAAVSLHGEVQKEVLASLLEERYGVRAVFSETTTVCLERVRGTGSAVDRIKGGDNPYLATIGLRLEPAPIGSGVTFSPGIERGNLPPAFIAATEEGTRAALRQGLANWAVTDCLVTMTESGYYPRQSKPHQKFDKAVSSVAADFRSLAQVVAMTALERAGTVVCEPIERFDLEVPDAEFDTVLGALARTGAATHATDLQANGWARLSGEIASAAVADFTAGLPDLTGGEAVFTSRVDHYAPTKGDAPRRKRSGLDPRDRTLWFKAHPR